MNRALLVVLAASSSFAESWTVTLTDPGARKLNVIKEVRAATGLGLKETKDLVEAPMPQLVRSGLTEVEARATAKALEAAGAKVELRSDGATKAETTPARPAGVSVRLESFGQSKIQCIKVVREATGLGLAETKKLVESAPVVVKEGLGRSDAQALVEALRAIGATANVVDAR